MKSPVSIIYFAYLGDEPTEDDLVRRRLLFMDRQLQWLAELVRQTEPATAILVPYVAPRAWDDEVQRAVSRHGFAVDPASVRADRLNRFEYPGFRAMKELAGRLPPDHLIFYGHSKGIVHLEEAKMGLFRLHSEAVLTADVGEMAGNPSLTRACLFPSRFGWCWYNFFLVKAGYMAGLPVEESADRYHFEALVGDRSDKEGFRGVLPLIGRLPFAETGIAAQPWYRPAETVSPTLLATYARYAEMNHPRRRLA